MKAELNPTDEVILEVLDEGRATPSYISEKTGYTQQNISTRLRRLIENDLVEKLHTGLYEKKEDESKDGHYDPLREQSPGSFYPCTIKNEEGEIESVIGIVDKSNRLWKLNTFIRRARDAEEEPIGELPDLPRDIDAEDELEELHMGH